MILYASEAALWLQQNIQHQLKKAVVVALLADHNTQNLCMPVLNQLSHGATLHLPVISIPAGEPAKNLNSLSYIWESLTRLSASRDALLICLGGGMITDIGGFAASTYKRGINLVHVPTTLLAMVDAAIGGKTGIDFLHFKNHIGTFYNPTKVLIFTEFLHTLPERQIKAGFAELVKYALINALPIPQMPIKQEVDDWMPIVKHSADAKLQITSQDFTEAGLRKVLNFGHTIGHAIETQALEQGIDLLHGEAVAAGMLAELWLSVHIKGMAEQRLEEYGTFYASHYKKPPFGPSDIPDLIARMRHDKKNTGNSIRFVLINNMLKAEWDVLVKETMIARSLEFLFAF